MGVISVENLKKIYKVHVKPQGRRASIKALFRRRYKHVHAVDGISFVIEPGEMVGFLGPNGAGKTTTLKMLSGLIYPTQGSARVLGFVPWERKDAFRRQFALLMGQKNQLWWDLPAADSFRLHKEIYGIDDRSFERVQGELTELLEVVDLLHQPVRELSLGERMKMELIAALLHSPSVLFLDEPTIGLDVVAQASIRRCLREYNVQRNVTIVLTSHYMQDVEALCHRVIAIRRGRLVHDGPLADILNRFTGHKILTLRFQDGAWPDRVEELGDVVAVEPPQITLRVPRDQVAQKAAELLNAHAISDVSIEDPPIEEAITEMFEQASEDSPELMEPVEATDA